jgi:peptidyl-prolyl cis-trans isomerase C
MTVKEITKTPWFRIITFGMLLAVVLLIVFGPDRPANQNRRVVVSEENLAHLVVSWQKTWQRSPTKEELLGLLQNHVRDEVLYREAVNRGMAENNMSVRRALVTQMNLLAESQVEQSALTEKEVQSFYSLRKDQYRQEPRISFQQVYFKQENLAQLSDADLQSLISSLNQDQQAFMEVGDPIMLPPLHNQQTPSQVGNQFGTEFAEQLFQVDDEGWTGPITSGFGSHLVKVLEKTNQADAPLEQVWDQVVNDLVYEEKQAAKEQFYTELLRQYDVSYQGMVQQLVD